MKITQVRRLASLAGLSLLAASSVSLVLGAAPAFAASESGTHGSNTVTLTTTANSEIDTFGNVNASTLTATSYDVDVAGTGFTPAGTGIQIVECPGNAGQTNPAAADYIDGSGCLVSQTGDTSAQSNASGAFSGHDYSVTEINGPSASTSCNYQNVVPAGEPNAGASECALYVGTQVSDLSQPHVLLQIDFPTPPGAAKPPVLVTPDAVSVQEGNSASGNVLTGVTGNTGSAACAHPCDSNSSTETVNAVSSTPVVAPTEGVVTINANGSFTYTPNTFPPSQTYPVTDTFTVAGPTAGLTGDSPATSTAGNNVVVNVSITAPPPGLKTFTTNAVTSQATTVALGNVRGIKVGDTLAFTGITGGPYIVSGVDPLANAAPYQTVTFSPGLAAAAPAGTTVADSTATETPAAGPFPGNGQSLNQIIQIPLTGGSLTMTQDPASPTDILVNQSDAVDAANEPCGFAATAAGYQLTGQPIFACGALTPVTVINATGTSAQWSVTATLTDFLDGTLAATHTTVASAEGVCDIPANYSRDCIPAGNLQWGPVAAVAQDLVPGDVGTVTAGNELPDVPYTAAAVCTQAGLTAVDCQNNAVSVGAIGTTAGGGWVSSTLHTDAIAPAATWYNTNTNATVPETLCSSPTTLSGGTFDCGANLEVAVPASVAADSSPFNATMILTLS